VVVGFALAEPRVASFAFPRYVDYQASCGSEPLTQSVERAGGVEHMLQSMMAEDDIGRAARQPLFLLEKLDSVLADLGFDHLSDVETQPSSAG
jgi:hypothetical protein